MDSFVSIASDGVWSHIEPTEMAEIITEHGHKSPGNTCELIAAKVKDLCHGENTPMDDTSLIISSLSGTGR